MNFEADPTKRFSRTVEFYARFRPGYPERILEFLSEEIGLTPDSIVGDIGSGTGILSEVFLKNGNTVYGVEPNLEMRQYAEESLNFYPQFYSVAGSAESTELQTASVDVISAGQAFHWFDVPKARQEFLRISRDECRVAILFNNRRTEASEFLQAYENLVRTFAIDYKIVNHQNLGPDDFRRFFGHGNYRKQVFENSQFFDHLGLQGRVFSSSYMPPQGHPNYEPMLLELKRLFDVYHQGGTVSFDYDTEVYCGIVAP